MLTYYHCLSFHPWQHRNTYEILPLLLWKSPCTMTMMLQVQYQVLWFRSWLILIFFKNLTFFCFRFLSLWYSIRIIQSLQEIVKIYPHISAPVHSQEGKPPRAYNILLLFQVLFGLTLFFFHLRTTSLITAYNWLYNVITFLCLL